MSISIAWPIGVRLPRPDDPPRDDEPPDDPPRDDEPPDDPPRDDALRDDLALAPRPFEPPLVPPLLRPFAADDLLVRLRWLAPRFFAFVRVAFMADLRKHRFKS